MFDPTTLRQLVELIAGVVIILRLLGAILVQTSLLKKDKVDWGFDRRVIQFLTIVFIVPAILILALEEILDKQATATLIGAITGYVLSGIGGKKE